MGVSGSSCFAQARNLIHARKRRTMMVTSASTRITRVMYYLRAKYYLNLLHLLRFSLAHMIRRHSVRRMDARLDAFRHRQ